jgi:hypothetical protein
VEDPVQCQSSEFQFIQFVSASIDFKIIFLIASHEMKSEIEGIPRREAVDHKQARFGIERDLE